MHQRSASGSSRACRRLATFSLLALLSLGVTACQTDGGATASPARSTETGAAGKVRDFGDYGFSITMAPVLRGNFEAGGESSLSLFTAKPDIGIIIDAAWVGEAVADDYALAHAVLGAYGLSYPHLSVSRLEPTVDDDGQRWLHFEAPFTARQLGERLRKFSVTRRGTYVYTLAAIVPKSAPEALREAAFNAWAGVEFSTPRRTTPVSRLELRLSREALAPICLSYLSRQRFLDALNAADTFQRVAPEDEGLIVLTSEILIRGRMYEEGLERMPQWQAAFPKSRELAWRRAFMLGELERTDEALEAYNHSIRTLRDHSPAALSAYFSFLQKVELLGERAAEVEELADKAGYPQHLTFVAAAWAEAGDKDRLAAVMQRLEREAAMLPDLNEALVNLYMEQEDFEAALALSRRISAEQKDPAGNLLAAAVLFREGRYSEARREVQACLERQPTNSEARSLLEVINAQLGKADTSLFQTPIAPVPLPLPDGFLESVAAVPADFGGDHGAYLSYSGTLYDFSAGKRTRTTSYERFTVTRQSALRRMSERVYRFDPLYERIHVNYLRVYDPQGELVAEGNLENYYTTADTDEVLRSQRRELHLPIPSLDVGGSVELCISYETLGPQIEMNFEKEILASTLPGQLFFTGIMGDVASVAVVTANGVREQQIEGGRLFVAEDPVPMTLASSTPPAKEYLPMVWLTGAGKTWEGLSAEYLERVVDFLKPSQEAAEKTRELTGENPDDADAIARVTTFVRDTMTYQGLVFGIRSQIPNYCVDILNNRYGDCKDHSFLLLHMLRSAGIRAYPALVDTEKSAQPGLPDIGQFNHMIVYLPDFEGGHFIDATDKFATLRSTPYGLADEPALVLDPEDPRIVTIPAYRAEENQILIDREMQLSENNSLRVTERVELEGLAAGWLRELLQDVTEMEYPLAIANAFEMREFGNIADVRVQNLDNRELPLVLSYNYSLENQFHNVGGIVTGRTPGTWEQLLLRIRPEEKERRAPIWHRMPLTIQTSMQLALPQGYELSSALPLGPVQTSTPYLSVDFHPSNGGGTLSFKTTLSSPQGLFPASEAQARRQALERASAAVQHPIALERPAR